MPLDSIKTFIKEKIIGKSNCKEQTDEVKEIRQIADVSTAIQEIASQIRLEKQRIFYDLIVVLTTK